MVPRGAVVADIGTDHAYLPIHLIQTGRIKAAVASDISCNSLAKARQAVVDAELQDKISLRLGWGLSVLCPGEAESVVIAGLGPETIMEIIAKAEPAIVARTDQFVLQPMQNPGRLRRYFSTMGLTLSDEVLVKEDHRFYVIMLATPGKMQSYSPELLEIGPHLVARSDPLLPDYVAYKISREERIYEATGASHSSAGRARQNLAKRRIDTWEMMLNGSSS